MSSWIWFPWYSDLTMVEKSCLAHFFIYLFLPFFIFLFLPFFIFYLFALSLCHSFCFFSTFLEPEPNVTWINKLHWHFIFYMVCNGKSKQHRQIRCSGFFLPVPGFLPVPVFHGALGCSGVFQRACTKTRNTGTPRNTGTVGKTRNTDFDGVVLLSYYRPCKK